MIQLVMSLVAALTVALDIVAYKRLVRNRTNRTIRIVFALFATIANTLIWIGPALILFPTSNEVEQSLMRGVNLALTLYILFTSPRLLLYLFTLTTRNKRIRTIGITLATLLLGTLLYGITITRTAYITKEIMLQFDNLPKGFDGYRIAFISDIHIGSMCNANRELGELSQRIEETDADLLIFGGDLVNLSHQELTPTIIKALSRIKGKSGTVAVLGNHDTGTYLVDTVSLPRSVNVERVCEAMQRAGWRVLRDQTEFVHHNGDSIAITGIDFSEELLRYKHSFDTPQDFDPQPIFESFPKELFNITISHLPQLWHPLCDGGYSDLTLAGHVHSTQIKAVFGTTQLSPAMLMHREWSGLYSLPNGKLYITDGIGYVGFYGRFGANPEITVITLKSPQQ